MLKKWQDISIPFNLKIAYKQEEKISPSNPFKKSYYLTFQITGHIPTEMMGNMPSFAKFVTIKEISESLGITPLLTGNTPSYDEIKAMASSGKDLDTYHPNEKEENIFFPIEPQDKNIESWTLLKNYNRSYPYGTYRNQNFYENILIKTDVIFLTLNINNQKIISSVNSLLKG